MRIRGVYDHGLQEDTFVILRVRAMVSVGFEMEGEGGKINELLFRPSRERGS